MSEKQASLLSSSATLPQGRTNNNNTLNSASTGGSPGRSESVSPSGYGSTLTSPDEGRYLNSPGRFGSSYGNSYNRPAYGASRYGGGGYGGYGNYGSYGNAGAYGGGYGQSYGGYGSGYGGYGNAGAYGPGAMQGPPMQGPMRPGENTLGYLHHLTDDCGRFAGLLTANADALHGSFASLLGLMEMCTMLYRECGYVLSGFTLFRFINRFFGWILGESKPKRDNSFVKEFSAKKKRGFRWGSVLALFVFLSLGIPLIRALFRKLAQLMKEEEEKHRIKHQQLLVLQQQQQQQQQLQQQQHLSQQHRSHHGRNYTTVR